MGKPVEKRGNLFLNCGFEPLMDINGYVLECRLEHLVIPNCFTNLGQFDLRPVKLVIALPQPVIEGTH